MITLGASLNTQMPIAIHLEYAPNDALPDGLYISACIDVDEAKIILHQLAVLIDEFKARGYK